MDNENLNQLEAENNRLKRIMKHMYHDVSGSLSNKNNDNNTVTQRYFPYYISNLLVPGHPLR